MTAGLSVAGTSSSAGTSTCAVITVCTPGGECRTERLEPRLDVAGDRRQLEVGVLLRRAVPGEVLDASGDATRLRAANVRGDVPRDERRVGAERARADHGVRRDVDVGDRRVVPVDAGGGELGGDRRRDAPPSSRARRARRAPRRPGTSCRSPTRAASRPRPPRRSRAAGRPRRRGASRTARAARSSDGTL